MKLFMILLGCTPTGRFTEQHDIFFGIGEQLSDLKQDMKAFWNVKDLHIDAWREVTTVGSYSINPQMQPAQKDANLYFVNLGGYKQREFDEFHYKMLVAAQDQGAAIKEAKQTVFFKTTGFKGAPSHIDDKYGVDVDDIYNIDDILSSMYKEKYSLSITESAGLTHEDELHLGYLRLEKL